MQTAFEPELSAGAAISEREREHGPSATRETTNRREIAYLDAYDRHLQQRSERESGERFVPWRGPPVRGTCIDPLVARLRALADLAEEGARKFGAGHARRGKRASLALDTWETSYAKRCWKFICEECGASAANKMSSADDGDFVTFIRAIAEYASGEKIETGFGGAAKIAVKWGRPTSSSGR